MLSLIRHQIIDGLLDSKFMIMAVLVLLAFVTNGFVFSEKYRLAAEDYDEAVANATDMLQTRAGSLTDVVGFAQRVVKPPSALGFVADGGEDKLPNRLLVNAFAYGYPGAVNRGNDMFELLPSLDWVFIIGTLMTLMALLISFGAICGEKREGTLRLLMSNPLSRLTLFFSKYLGLLVVLVVVLILGALLNLSILWLNGALPLTEEVAISLGWVFLLSVLCLSLMLLLGLAISAMVHRPAVALVILMLFWLVGIVAIPGIAKLVGSQFVDVPTDADMQRSIDDIWENIWMRAAREEGAGAWYSRPDYAFTDEAKARYRAVTAVYAEVQKVRDEVERERIRQAELVLAITTASPAGLLNDAFQKLSGTGISGYESFFATARRYNQQLRTYAVETDQSDPASPHSVCGWGLGGSHDGMFSSLPVDLSSIPRYHSLWLAGGLYEERPLPALHILILLSGNLLLAVIAFLALMRYDLR